MPKRVLIVDDMMFMRASLRRILEQSGYEVVGEAENGKEGVLKFKQLMPDLVTLDLTMPVMDGIEALRKIKEIKKDVAVIVISAMGQEKNVLKAIQLGAKNFIVKPFKPDKVIGIIKKVIGK